MEKFEASRLNIYIREKQGLNYHAHYHKSIEVIYVFDGGGENLYVDGIPYHLEQGSLMITFPNQVHYYESMKVHCAVIMFEPAFVDDYRELFENYTCKTPVIYGLQNNPRIATYMRMIIDAVREKDEGVKMIAKGIMTAFLAEIFPLLELEKNNDEVHHSSLKRILAYCDKNYKNADISLRQMSEELYLSYQYVSRVFSCKLKIGFTQYINLLRVMEAKTLLTETSSSVSQIAMECGFNSLCTFNRAFRKNTKQTPTEYRKRHCVPTRGV